MKLFLRSLAVFAVVASVTVPASLITAPAASAHSVGLGSAILNVNPASAGPLIDRVFAGEGGLQSGDIIEYVITSEPFDNGAVDGPAGYVTFYPPDYVTIVGASFVQPDGNDFVDIPAPDPGPYWDGVGTSGGQAPWNAPFDDINAWPDGSLLQLQGDTGIFYSTDPRTAKYVGPGVDPETTPLGDNGYIVDPTACGQLQPAGWAECRAHNDWDRLQVIAFGAGNNGAVIDRGRGNTPYLAASPVAGPDAFYKHQHDTLVGPYQRIAYPGSTIGMGDAPDEGLEGDGPIVSTAGVAWDYTTDGIAVSETQPLSGANQVRWSVGELVVGEIIYVKVALRIDSVPNGCTTIDAEVFGSDAGVADGGKDNPWRYYVPIPALGNACVVIQKTGPDSALADTEVTYTVRYANIGPSTLTNVQIQDALDANTTFVSASDGATHNNGVVSWPTLATLGADEAAEYTVTVRIDAGTTGTVRNTASLVTDQTPLSSAAKDTVIVPDPADLAVSKIVNNETPNEGDTVTYDVSVQNLGPAATTNVTVDDLLPAGVTFSSMTGDGSYDSATGVWTVGDLFVNGLASMSILALVDVGTAGQTITNTADNPQSALPDINVANNQASAVITVAQNPAIELIKSSDTIDDTVVDGVVGGVGDTINYSFDVTNTGDVILTNITLTDDTAVVAGGPIATMAPGATDTATFTATYVITQADVDSGEVVNSAAVTGLDPNNTPVIDISDSTNPALPGPDDPTVTPLPTDAEIELIKSSDTIDDTVVDGVVGGVGDTINYSFEVTNTGVVTLTNITLTDDTAVVAGGPIATMAPGTTDTATFTATYVITQADVDSGEVINSATATGLDPNNTPVTDISDSTNPALPGPDDPTITPLPSDAEIELIKTSDTIVDTVVDGVVGGVGDTINYSFDVTNTGVVTLTNVTLDDTIAVVSGGPIATMAPGATDTATFTATYVITQADVDSGEVINSATVTGLDPNNTPVTDISDSTNPALPGPDDPTITPLSQNPAIELIKSSDTIDDTVVDGVVGGVGDTINYSFDVTNTGDVTLTNVTLDDTIALVAGGPIATMAPGATDTTTFTATYVITQADVDSGEVINSATVTGLDPNNTAVTDISDSTNPALPGPDDPTITPLSQNPAIELIKSSDTIDDTVADGVVGGAGDTINYSFDVTNTGDVTLTNITLTDDTAVVAGGPIATMAPGQVDTTTFTATYVITQADVDAGEVINSATVTGLDPNNAPVSDISDSTNPALPGPDDPTITPLSQNPAIELIKSSDTIDDTVVDGVVGGAGDTINYSFDVTNIGDVTLTDITLVDDTAVVAGGPIASLPPGFTSTTTFTATYVITQADVDAGEVINSATVTGLDPNNAPVSDISDSTNPALPGPDDPTITPLPNDAEIELIKSSDTIDDTIDDGVLGGVGDTINYSFEVTNTGVVTLTNITLTDDTAVVAGGPIATMAPGQVDTTTFTAIYVITQADIDSGEVINSATVTGLDPTNTPVTDISDSTNPALPGPDDPTTTPLSQNPDIELIKASAGIDDTVVDGVVGGVGDTINYSFDVTNTGDVTLTNVTLDDTIALVAGGPIATMAPGQVDTTTFTATYVITQADIDSGEVINSATVTGLDPNNTPVTDVSDSTNPALPGPDDPTITPLSQNPLIELIKSSDTIDDTVVDGVVGGVGDTINYSFDVTNTGNVTLTNVTLDDTIAVVAGGPIASMAPGTTDTATFTATYVITQADVDAGGVINSATVTGLDPDNTPVSDISDSTNPALPGPDDPTVTPLSQNPLIELIKSSDTIDDTVVDGVVGGVGDTINYSFDVTNTGDVTLTNITLTDDTAVVAGGPIASMAPGATDTATFTATYVITQTDVDAAEVINSATVTGLDPNNTAVTDISDSTNPALPGPDDPTVTPLSQNPLIELIKSSDTIDDTVVDGVVGGVGDTINYSFDVTNTGDVTLTDVTLIDTIAVVAGGPIASMAPGATDTATFTATYVITQADIDSGEVINSATVTGLDPNNTPVTDISDSTNPALPGPDDPTITPLSQNPDIELIKASAGIDDTVDDGLVGGVGDTINFSFEVTNTGDVTLTDVTLVDDTAVVAGGPIATMAPGQVDTTTFTATYVITQADIDSGEVINSATVTGLDPNNTPVSDISDSTNPALPGPDDPTITPLPKDAQIELIKSSDTIDDTIDDGVLGGVGDTINYSFDVTNTGIVTLTNVTLDDTIALVAGGPIATMAPGATDTATFTATYVITQADVDAAEVINSATVTGLDPNNTPVTDISDSTNPALPGPDDPTITPLPQSPAIQLIKSSDTIDDTVADGVLGGVGDTINYSFDVTNTGDVTLTDVTLIDTIAVVSGGPIATMAPGATDTATFTATYVITQADVDAAEVINSATVTGLDADNTAVSDISDSTNPALPGPDDPTVTVLSQNPAIELIKSSDTIDDTVVDGVLGGAGDTINYSFDVTNTGDVTLTNVTLDDTIALVAGGPIATMAPGQVDTTTFTATYVITQADVDSGEVINSATVTGLDPNDTAVTDISDSTNPALPGPDDPTVTPLSQNPLIELIKSSDTIDDTVVDGVVGGVGDTINYSFDVTNTGNVTLTDVTLDDTIALVAGGPIATMAPGATDTATFSATYVITQADVDSGEVINSATVTGLDPNNTPVTDISDSTNPALPGPDDPTITPLSQNPAIELIKSSDTIDDTVADGVVGGAGDTINYSFDVTNTGDVTLTNVTLDDSIAVVSGGPIATMAPGATDTTAFTATYVITQADVDAGEVINSATVTGLDPNNTAVTDISDSTNPALPGPDDPTITPLPTDAEIELIKSSDIIDDTVVDGVVGGVGDTINYSFVVTNTGIVTLTDVTLDDTIALVAGGPIATMAPGATDTTTFTATYVITQADVDAAEVINSATVTGLDPNNTTVTDISDSTNPALPGPDDPTVTVLSQNPAIELIKSSDTIDDTVVDGVVGGVGDTINYSFDVTNTGDVTLTDVTLVDDTALVAGGPIVTMAPGATDTATFTATYVITQADVDAAEVINSATVTGLDPNNIPVSDISDSTNPALPGPDDPTVTPLSQNPLIELIKSSDTIDDTVIDGVVGGVGDTINYSFDVTNTGDVTLTDVTLDDTIALVAGGPIVTMAPGATDTATFTATYVITQADVDSGEVINSATVTGLDPNNTPVSDISDSTNPALPGPDDPTITPLSQNPLIELIKSSDTIDDTVVDGVVGGAGDTINYSFEITNTGNVTLTNVTLDDTIALVAGGPIATMAPGATDTATFTATYVITQADVDSGEVINSATVTGLDPNNTPVTDISDSTNPALPGPDDPTITPLPSDAEIELIKSSDTIDDTVIDGVVGGVGDTINYSFDVTNTGVVTLTNVTLDDTIAVVSGGPIATMAPGATDTATFTATYVITQADVDAAEVINSATVTGLDPSDTPVTDVSDSTNPALPGPDDPTITPLSQNPLIELIKSSDTIDDTVIDGVVGGVGDTISYSFEITNTGNVTLTNVTLDDTIAVVAGGPIATMAPGATDTTTFTATYVITQADVDAAEVINSATVTGLDPNNTPVSDISDSTNPALPGPDDPTITPLSQNPAIELIKSSDTIDDTFVDGVVGGVGDTINYSFDVTNTGDVTLTDVTLDDTIALVAGGPIATMAPGQVDTTTFTATYVITQADVDAAEVINSATVTGLEPNNTPVTDISDSTNPALPGPDDPTITPLSQAPDIELIKASAGIDDTVDDGLVGGVGDTINFSFEVTNTGDVTLTDVTLVDDTAVVAGGPIATMAPGATDTATFTATYVITQADIDSGEVINSATVTGLDPNNTPVSDISDSTNPALPGPDDPTVTPLPKDAQIELIKSSDTIDDTIDDGVVGGVGDTINYSFDVTNTGVVTLTNVTLDDTIAVVAGGPIATMAPGATNTTTFTATYVITQADVDAGEVINSATVTGLDPDNTPVSDISDSTNPALPGPDDPTITPLSQNPAIQLIKSSDTIDDTVADGVVGGAGDTINYSFEVTNTGDVTLTDVTLVDDTAVVAGGPIATMAPGQVDTTTFTATYVITQADVDSAEVINSATVTGLDADNTAVSDISDSTNPALPGPDDPTITPLPTDAEIDLIKSSDTIDDTVVDGVVGGVGDTINYSFVVTNTGIVTLTDVTLDDTIAVVAGGPIATMAPGQVDTTTFTATYVITQADIDSGEVINSATVTGLDPNNTPVTDISDSTNPALPGPDDPTITPLSQNPAIELIKSSDTIDDTVADGVVGGAGDTINYSFDVTNTGDVTLTNITLIDDTAVVAGGPIASMAPGATDTATFTATYVITQADVDSGEVINSATVTGLDPNNTAVTDISDSTNPALPGPDDPTITPLPTDAQIELIKSSDTIDNTIDDGVVGGVGDTINYSFDVTNTGVVTLTDVTLDDTIALVAGGPIATMAPGQVDTTTFAATYVITQADVDAAEVINSATVAGLDPDNTAVSDVSDSTNPALPGPDDPTVTVLSQNPAIELIKSSDTIDDTVVDGVVGGAGDTINYSFDVTNTGNVTLTNVTLDDTIAVVAGGPIATMAPGQVDTTTFTATYVITQADVDAAEVINSATVTGLDPNNTPVTDISDSTNPALPGPDDPTITPLSQNPAIQLIKSSDTIDDTAVDGVVGGLGDTLNYSFEVTNIGDVTLTNITLTDDTAAVAGDPIASMAPGATDTATFTATYVITQADVDSGEVINSATVTGLDPNNTPVTDISDSTNPALPGPDDPTITPLSQNPAIELIKSSDTIDDTFVDGVVGGAGDTINYSFDVTNIGDVTLTNITLTDDTAAVAGGPIASLAPGFTSTTTFTATYVITQADVDSGEVINSATVTGIDPNNTPVSDISDSTNPALPGPDDPTITPLSQNPLIELIKSSAGIADTIDDGVVGGAGDTINYSFDVTNTGNVTLTNVTLADDTAVVAGGPIASMAPGATDTATFTASYVITQADVDSGEVINSATVTGLDPNNTPVSDISDSTNPALPGPDDPTITALPKDAQIELIKSSDTIDDTVVDGVVGGVGDTINYSFDVTNTGVVTLTDVTLDDTIALVAGGPIATMAPGATDTATFTATYVITQADVDAAEVINSATVTGLDPSDTPVTDVSDSTNPALPGPDDPTITPLSQNPAIQLIKSSDTIDDTVIDGVVGGVGDTINYSFDVTNTGDVTLTNITLTDDTAVVAGGPIATMAPGTTDTATFTATYVITQADVDSGEVINSATVTGLDPNNTPVTDISDSTNPALPGPDDPTITPLSQNPLIELIKSSDTIDDTVDDGVVGGLGDTINYSFDVTNTGNVTLTNVTLDDTIALVAGGPIATMAPNATDTATFTATYVITQADIDNGEVINTATVTGLDPDNTPVTDISDSTNPALPGPDDPTITPLSQNPLIELIKSSDTIDDTVVDGVVGGLGDTINYSFEVTNTGDVTLSDVTLIDDTAVVAGGPIASMAPDAIDTATFTATYVITQADVDAGGVINSATVTGLDPNNTAVSDISDSTNPALPGPDDPTITPLSQNPGIDLVKEATSTTDTIDDGIDGGVGDTINYSFVVTNTGLLTLADITLVDDTAVVAGGPIATMAPGQVDTTTFTATYVITQADIDSGEVINSATVTGLDPNNTPVTDISDSTNPALPGPDDPTITPLSQNPAIELIKTVTSTEDTLDDDIVGGVGDTINYSFDVTNTGNVTLTDVTLIDIIALVAGGPIASMAPGATDTTTFTATYVITQADVDAGEVINSATATGLDPQDNPVSDVSDSTNPALPDTDDPTVTVLPQNPSIDLIKTVVSTEDTVDDGNVGGVGDTIIYRFAVSNTGNITLTGITLADDTAVVSGGPVASMAPGDTDKVTFTATHVITQDDVDAGEVINSATVTGFDPKDNPVSDISDSTNPALPGPDDPTITVLERNGQIELTKTSGEITNTIDDEVVGGVGDTINYSFEITNTGNVTLTDITLVDDTAEVAGGPIATMAPGATDTATFTATYVITQADVHNERVLNSATVTGFDPTANPVLDVSDSTNPADDSGDPDDPTVTRFTAASIGGTLWHDLDADGVIDDDEEPIEGVTVTLTGDPDEDGEVSTLTLVTSASGQYGAEVMPGLWTVTIDRSTVPFGMAPTTNTSTQLTVGANETATFNIGQTFGMITGTVWIDLDRDGVIDPDEPDLAGVTLVLVCPGPDGVFDTDDDIRIEAINADVYRFDGVPVGQDCTITVDRSTVSGELEQTYDLDGLLDSAVVVGVPNIQGVTDVNFGYSPPRRPITLLPPLGEPTLEYVPFTTPPPTPPTPTLPAPTLAHTGSESSAAVSIAMVAMLLGGLMVVVARRRKREKAG